MRKVRKEIQRQALYGWLWWAPMPMLILGALVVDAWLNIETRRHDYEMNSYKEQITTLEAALTEVRTKLAGQQDLDQLTKYAEQLGLDDPAPGQVRLMPVYAEITDAKGNLVLARTEDAPETDRVPRREELPAMPVAPVLAPPPAPESEKGETRPKDLDASLDSLLESI